VLKSVLAFILPVILEGCRKLWFPTSKAVPDWFTLYQVFSATYMADMAARVADGISDAFGPITGAWIWRLVMQMGAMFGNLLDSCLLATPVCWPPSMPRTAAPGASAAAAAARRVQGGVSQGPWGLLAAILQELPAAQAPQVLRAAAKWADAVGMQGPPGSASLGPAVVTGGKAKAYRRRGCRGGMGKQRQQASHVAATQAPAPPATTQGPRPQRQTEAMEVEEGPAAARPAAVGTATLVMKQLRQTTLPLSPRLQTGTSVAAATVAAPASSSAQACKGMSGLAAGFLLRSATRASKRFKAAEGSPRVPMVGAGLPVVALPPVQ
jgi:hypothetical protein